MEQLPEFEQVNKYADQAIEMGMAYAPQLALAIVTLLLGLWIINRVVAGLGRAFERSGMDETLRKFIRNLINVGLKALLLISVAAMVGIETTSFIAVLGAAGLAVGLALQGSLANFAGGVLILLFKPFRVGEFIDSNGHAGTVQEIGILHTVMTTPDNKTIILPNGPVANSAVVNFSRQPTRRVEIIFGISYDDDMAAAKEALWTIIREEERVLAEPVPIVVISALADSSVNITVRVWVNSADFFPVFWDLTERGKLALEAAGMTIPFPQRDIHFYQESGGTD